MDETELPFDSPRLLIARAKENFEEFEARGNAFFTQKVGAFRRDVDPKTGDHFISFRLKEAPPANLRGIFSDGVNNLRHALDQAVNASATMLRGGAADCYFPVARDAGEFAKIFTIKRYRPTPVELQPFLHALKPYRGGNDLLWSLSRMTGPNKHQVVLKLHPKVDTIEMGSLTITASHFSIPIPKWDSSKNELVVARMSADAKVRGDIQVPVDIVLGAADIVEGLPALGVSHAFTRIVEGIVSGLEAETARLLAERDNAATA